MKIVRFRPLRRVKKTGKIVVASYMQWRKIKTEDKAGLSLLIDPDYKNFDANERVFKHNGDDLFWEDYDPEGLPDPLVLKLTNSPIIEYNWKTDFMYSARGLDVDGVPTFSHLHPEAIFHSKQDMANLEPLTVGTVRFWLGWFLYKLENTTISYTI